MNKLFELTEEFVARANEIEMEFAFSVADSIYEDGSVHHDKNYREAHHRAFGDSLDLFMKFKGKLPEPMFSDVINNLLETISTDCGW